MQFKEMMEDCKRRKWAPVKFQDVGWSGSKESRPGFDQMMNEVRRGRIDVVMVYKFDRFARSLKQLILALEEFNARNVQFISVHEHLDTTTSMGRFVFQIIGAIAEFERELTRERVRSGIAHARAQGKHLGRPRANLDPSYITKRRAQGAEWGAIAEELDVSKETCRRTVLNATKGA